MPPKRTVVTTTPMIDAKIKALIAQGVADALAEHDVNRRRNGDDSLDSGSDRRSCAIACEIKFATCTLQGNALTWWNSYVRTVRHDVAYATTWKTLKKMTTDEYSLRGEIKKLEIKLWNLKVKGTNVESYSQHFQELALMCSRMFPKELYEVEKYAGGLLDMIQGSVLASKPKKIQDAIEFETELMDQKIRTLAERQAENKRKFENTSRNNQNQHQPFKRHNVVRAYTAGPGKKNHTEDLNLCALNATTIMMDSVLLTQGHFKSNCLKLKNKNQGNQVGKGNAVTRAYGVGTSGTNPNSNVAIEMGSFDVIIGMDWLSKYHVVIVCDEKIIRIPFGNEILIVHGDGSNNEQGSRLNIISCTKTQKYLLKGCHVFLAHVTVQKTEDNSEKKRLKDVLIVQDFPEVFLEDLPGIPPTRQVEFQIDLVPSAAPVARAPYRLAPSKMKELSDQLQKLSDKGFI
ncbi:putative reverse transcriptase domain-containing protein [Tanacetum coccineum]